MENKSLKDKIDRASEQVLPLGRRNFILMAIAGVFIVVGFLLMAGGDSTVEAYNPDIFSIRRIIVGPMIAFLGFVGMAVAIMLRPTKDNKLDLNQQ